MAIRKRSAEDSSSLLGAATGLLEQATENLQDAAVATRAAAAGAVENLVDKVDDFTDPLFADNAKVFKGYKKSLGELLAIVGDALAFTPPLYMDSILGHPWSLIPPHRSSSEYSMVSLGNLPRSFRYLFDSLVPALPIKIPEFIPGFSESAFFRATEIYFQPDQEDDPYSFPEEAWVFVNGIGTNYDLARVNAEYIATMFHRPMTIIQNATDSIAVDLLECTLGKAWSVVTEAAGRAYPFVLNALNNPHKKRVVVLCHSQGTIIMGNVLRALVDAGYRKELNDSIRRLPRLSGEELEFKPLTVARNLEKLEIYTFANCATIMPQATMMKTARGNPIPWIENFGNERDLVARCGMIAPKREERGIRIDGPNYVKKGMWGHSLNLHYLWGIHDHLKDPAGCENPYVLEERYEGKAAATPRLYGYYGGKVPEPY